MAFPLSPSNGQVTAVNGIVYTYDLANEAWYRSGATSANLITTDTANVTSNTSSVSTSTGALRVGGGAGIAGNLYVGGNVITTASFVTTGGVFWANGTLFSSLPIYSEVTSNVTLVANNKYFIDTSSPRTLTLPATARLGDEISIIDGTGTASTYAITIARNSGNIQGSASDMLITTNRAAFTLAYYNSTQGWLLTSV